MSGNENITVNVQVDTSNIEGKIEILSDNIGELKSEAKSICEALTEGFESNESGLEKIGNKTVNLTSMLKKCVDDITKVMDSSTERLVSEVTKILNDIAGINETTAISEMTNDSISGMSGAISMIKDLSDMIRGVNQPDKKATAKAENTDNSNNVTPKTQVGEMPELLSAPKNSENSDKSSSLSSNLVSGLLSDAGSMFPSAESMAAMAESIGSVATRLKESTVEWVTNTGAKAASTAAEWAHIAATTAWNAICTAATAVTTAFGAAISFLTSPIGLVLIAVTALIAIVVLLVKNWDTVKEVAAKVWQGIVDTWNTVSAWFDENVIQPVVQFFTDMWSGICKFATDAWNGIVAVFVGVATWFDQNVVQPVAGFFSDLWSGICGFASDAWDGIVEVFTGVATWFDENVVQPVVEIVDGIAEGFKNMVNGVIGFINGMISGIISGINGVIRALNKIQFTVPDWVPGLGGETLGFNLKTLTAPQIPYLAKGAVLPANKPFMAVVGDQRHGTNIEAPLATIQEAVGLVMEEHISAMMAGFQALLEEQRAIRRTVEGIEIGDDVIGRAVERYNRKMAVVYGI